MDDANKLIISTPEADLAQLSFCETDPAALSVWVQGLPIANTATAAAQIDQASREIARLAINSAQQLEMLETIRPPLHYICTRLDRAALKHSEPGEPLARAAQQLQTNLCIGYRSVTQIARSETSKTSKRETLPLALHRALSDISRTLLRTLQYFVSAPSNLWQELHQLYLLAEQLELSSHGYIDPENHHDTALSITEAYLRSIMLASCNPNQLRHQNLSLVFNALEHWASRVLIEPLREDSLFAIDLNSNRGPKYARLVVGAEQPRGIRTDVLIYELEAFLKEIDTDIPIPENASFDLLLHLVTAWGKLQPRSFRRTPTQGRLKVAVGLRATHYFLSGGVEFSEQVTFTDALLRREINPFLNDKHAISASSPTARADVWDNAFDLGVRIPVNPNILEPERILLSKSGDTATSAGTRPNSSPAFQFHDAQIIDTSPGGFRILWKDELPANLQSGELLAIRESDDSRWCIAVVRWIQQDGPDSSMGIELLAPKAIPVAARVIMKKGGPTDFARALLLPALKPINKPATLITPQVPFHENQKVHIHRQGIQTTAQLQHCQLKTESFNQFSFRMLDGYLENAHINLNIENLAELIGDHKPDEPR